MMVFVVDVMMMGVKVCIVKWCRMILSVKRVLVIGVLKLVEIVVVIV